jgi:hypothetical protein
VTVAARAGGRQFSSAHGEADRAAFRGFTFVGHDDHSRALSVDGGEKIHDRTGIFRIKVTGRLIRDKQARGVEQSPRNGDPPRFTPGKA